MEKELISKTFYQTLFEENGNNHPIKVLSDLFMEEEQKEVPELSHIRFAQGEVYFHNSDFETAIFKWENISNELKPWALKNIGDAHFELGRYAKAEEYYKAVGSKSDVLKTEVLLQLFSLYIRLDKLDLAVGCIKDAVQLNPDYPDVTAMAQAFFEDHQDWNNAVELVVNEAIRTESLAWFDTLKGYVEQGYTGSIPPNYFMESLMTLYSIDLARFENLAQALWQSYQPNQYYFTWLKEFNNLLLNLEFDDPYVWRVLSGVYKDTYFDLINGNYLIKEFSHLIPNHLANWLTIATTQDAMLASSAVLSWDEIFPADLGSAVVSQAEKVVRRNPQYQNAMDDVLKLFESIMHWAKSGGLVLGERFEWMVGELLDLNHYHVLVVGAASKGKPTFLNQLLDDHLLDGTASFLGEYEENDEEGIGDEGFRRITTLSPMRQSIKSQIALLPCRMPAAFMDDNPLTLMDAPVYVDQRSFRNQAIESLHLADSLVFVLNVDLHLSGKELDMAIRMREQAPDLPIHFLLRKTDQIANSQVAMELMEKTVSRIDEYFPEANIIAFSEYDLNDQMKELSTFANSVMAEYKIEEGRTVKILSYIRKAITFLLEKRMEKENAIMEKIEWEEELATKFDGAYNQLEDIEEQKALLIKRSYNHIKDELRQNLISKIPELVRGCAEMVTEDSDFGNIHVQLNDEMNNRIVRFIEDKALPDFQTAIQEWMQTCEGEFRDSQDYLNEMSASFNHLYGEEKIMLDCDFMVLDDWRRDMSRLTRGSIELDQANILLRTTPSQLLFKSAGKLLGALSKNKDLLHNKYKQFIESKDYSSTAEAITEKLMQPFDLFGRSLERDVKMFFAPPIQVLQQSMTETRDTIERDKEELNNIRKNPEVYRDPLTLFELKHRQYEWITAGGTGTGEVSQ